MGYRMKHGFLRAAALLFFMFSAAPVLAATPHEILRVGPGKPFALPSLAAQHAQDGDTVEIDAGVYDHDVATWKQNNLVIRAVNGRAHLRAAGANAEGKAIWVIKGNNVSVENIEFSGATVPDGNGAGIRIEGAGLILRHCFFHDNQNGILGGVKDGDVLVEYSEFARNGAGDGQTHNIYISQGKRFTLRYSYSHLARVGHNVKSRAQENLILYNRIMDEALGTASYAIDLPNGGLSFIIGNEIQQGPNTENSTIVSYGAEGLNNAESNLYFVNNTVVNDRPQGGRFLFVKPGSSTVRIVNNLFIGKAQIEAATAQMANNVFDESGREILDREHYNYHLRRGAKAINGGSAPGGVGNFSLTPEFEYLHPLQRQPRAAVGAIDVGAHEFSH
jgi:hypothetical protein